MNKKNICILYTGGTIGMVQTKKGFSPKPHWLSDKLHSIHLFKNKAVPNFTIIEYENLIDSSNAQPSDWVRTASDIIKYYNDYDGFIVLHGTDTLAYTASALSFMLENLGKPVICTGSQIPLSEIRTDAIDNVLDSLIIAANYEIPEVCIYFGKKLLRGNRTQKTDASAVSAFQSPNFPKLGEVGIDIKIKNDLLQPKPLKPIKLNVIKSAKVAILSIFPGIDFKIFDQILCHPLEGLVLKTYGAGNIANSTQNLKVLKKATEQGIIIVNCTQCVRGTVNMKSYATGQSLLESDVISGYDLTDEAALTKLYYLLSLGLTNRQIKKKMQENIRGELTKI